MPLLEALLALQAHIQEKGEPPATVYGICWNVGDLCELEAAVYSELKYAFQELQLDPHEPILSYNYHKERDTLWVGEQRDLRLALIQKLITYYQEQENGMAV